MVRKVPKVALAAFSWRDILKRNSPERGLKPATTYLFKNHLSGKYRA
jgi:hypothetical protein